MPSASRSSASRSAMPARTSSAKARDARRRAAGPLGQAGRAVRVQGLLHLADGVDPGGRPDGDPEQAPHQSAFRRFAARAAALLARVWSATLRRVRLPGRSARALRTP